MHIYGHTTYGHMSLTTVNDKNLWTKLKKKCHWSMSMTKKLSFTERYLSLLMLTKQDFRKLFWCSPRRIFWWRAHGGRFGHLIKCLIECESKQCSPDTHLAHGGRFGIFLKYSYKQKTIDHRQNLSGAGERMESLIGSVKILYWRPSL